MRWDTRSIGRMSGTLPVLRAGGALTRACYGKAHSSDAGSQRRLLTWALALPLALCACRHSQEDRPLASAPQNTQAKLDALRSLPYTDGGTRAGGDEREGVVVHDPARSCPGYSLYTVHAHSRAELIDERGTVIRTWSCSPSRVWVRSELLPGGDLLVIGADVPDDPHPGYADGERYIARFNWSGELLWKRTLTAHHDVELNPRDQLVTLTFKRRRIPEIHPQIDTRDDHVTLLRHDGAEIASVSLLDAFTRGVEPFTFQRVSPSRFGGDSWVDLFHANSVEWMRRPNLYGRHAIYAPSNFLICSRHQDTIAIIDFDTRQLVWSWGQGELSGPHDAQVLDTGNILVFDNGIHPNRQWSRVIELDPIRKEIVWEYKAPEPTDFFTLSRGSSQRLANGNTLIACSDKGEAFEVTPDGDIVWEFRCPYRTSDGKRAAIIRMVRHDRDFIHGILAKRTAAPQ